jgi:hypothetical protein
VRSYGFADGHAEMVHADSQGSFDPWESRHILPSPVQ